LHLHRKKEIKSRLPQSKGSSQPKSREGRRGKEGAVIRILRRKNKTKERVSWANRNSRPQELGKKRDAGTQV